MTDLFLDASYWQNDFAITDGDLNRLAGVLREAGEPRWATWLLRHVVEHKLARESDSLDPLERVKSAQAAEQFLGDAKTYHPTQRYQIGDEIYITRRFDEKWQIGRGCVAKTGQNNYGPYMEIDIPGESKPWVFMHGLPPDHKWARRHRTPLSGGAQTADEVLEAYSTDLLPHLQGRLAADARFASWGDQWWLADAVHSVPEEDLDQLHEALLRKDKPSDTGALLSLFEGKWPDTPGNRFSLNLALQADPERFDNDGTEAKPSWRAILPAHVIRLADGTLLDLSLPPDEFWAEHSALFSGPLPDELRDHSDLVQLYGHWLLRPLLVPFDAKDLEALRVHLDNVCEAQSDLDLLALFAKGPQDDDWHRWRFSLAWALHENADRMGVQFVGSGEAWRWALRETPSERPNRHRPPRGVDGLQAEPAAVAKEEVAPELDEVDAEVPDIWEPQAQEWPYTLTYYDWQHGILPYRRGAKAIIPPLAEEQTRALLHAAVPQVSDEEITFTLCYHESRPWLQSEGFLALCQGFHLVPGARIRLLRTETPGQYTLLYTPAPEQTCRVLMFDRESLQPRIEEVTFACEVDPDMLLAESRYANVEAWDRLFSVDRRTASKVLANIFEVIGEHDQARDLYRARFCDLFPLLCVTKPYSLSYVRQILSRTSQYPWFYPDRERGGNQYVYDPNEKRRRDAAAVQRRGRADPSPPVSESLPDAEAIPPVAAPERPPDSVVETTVDTDAESSLSLEPSEKERHSPPRATAAPSVPMETEPTEGAASEEEIEVLELSVEEPPGHHDSSAPSSPPLPTIPEETDEEQPQIEELVQGPLAGQTVHIPPVERDRIEPADAEAPAPVTEKGQLQTPRKWIQYLLNILRNLATIARRDRQAGPPHTKGSSRLAFLSDLLSRFSRIQARTRPHIRPTYRGPVKEAQLRDAGDTAVPVPEDLPEAETKPSPIPTERRRDGQIAPPAHGVKLEDGRQIDFGLPPDEFWAEYGPLFSGPLPDGLFGHAEIVQLYGCWLLRHLLLPFEQGELETIRDYLDEAREARTDVEILAEFGKHPQHDDWPRWRFSLAWALHKTSEELGIEFVGIGTAWRWAIHEAPLERPERLRPLPGRDGLPVEIVAVPVADVELELREVEAEEPEQEPEVWEPTAQEWPYTLTYYDWQHGILPYTGGAKAIIPPLVEEQARALLYMTAPQVAPQAFPVTLCHDERPPWLQSEGLLQLCQGFHLVPGARIRLLRTEQPDRFTLLYSPAPEQTSRVLMFESGSLRPRIQEVTFACEVDPDMLLTESRFASFPHLDRLFRIDQRTASKVLANVFESIGEYDEDQDLYRAQFHDLFPLLCVTKPYSLNYVRKILSKTARYPWFYPDQERGPNCYVYDPNEKGVRGPAVARRRDTGDEPSPVSEDQSAAETEPLPAGSEPQRDGGAVAAAEPSAESPTAGRRAFVFFRVFEFNNDWSESPPRAYQGEPFKLDTSNPGRAARRVRPGDLMLVYCAYEFRGTATIKEIRPLEAEGSDRRHRCEYHLQDFTAFSPPLYLSRDMYDLLDFMEGRVGRGFGPINIFEISLSDYQMILDLAEDERYFSQLDTGGPSCPVETEHTPGTASEEESVLLEPKELDEEWPQMQELIRSSQVSQTIHTLTGSTNRIVAADEKALTVATESGEDQVPWPWIKEVYEVLRKLGTIERKDVQEGPYRTRGGFRSAFIFGLLSRFAHVEARTKPRVALTYRGPVREVRLRGAGDTSAPVFDGGTAAGSEPLPPGQRLKPTRELEPPGGSESGREQSPELPAHPVNYWITPLRSVPELSAEECIRDLVGEKNIYAFSDRTPGRKEVGPGDQICFYIGSGVGVVGHATVASKPVYRPDPRIHDCENWPWSFRLRNTHVYLDKPITVDSELRARLDAFEGRDPDGVWGWFVLGLRKLTHHDFRLLTDPQA